MIAIQPAQDRGTANFGWLDSCHTFSFGEYYDPNHMGFADLRVIDEDKVTRGQGFSIHGHRETIIVFKHERTRHSFANCAMFAAHLHIGCSCWAF